MIFSSQETISQAFPGSRGELSKRFGDEGPRRSQDCLGLEISRDRQKPSLEAVANLVRTLCARTVRHEQMQTGVDPHGATRKNTPPDDLCRCVPVTFRIATQSEV